MSAVPGAGPAPPKRMWLWLLRVQLGFIASRFSVAAIRAAASITAVAAAPPTAVPAASATLAPEAGKHLWLLVLKRPRILLACVGSLPVRVGVRVEGVDRGIGLCIAERLLSRIQTTSWHASV